MSVLVLALLVVGALGLLVVVAGAVALVRSFRSPPAVPPGPVPPLAPAVASTWNLEVLGGGVIGAMGGTLNAIYGTLHVDDGRASFTVDGATGPAWTVACRDLHVIRQGLGPFAVASLRLVGPMGEIRCNASREHLNRVVDNPVKDLRESGYADALARALSAHGARLS
ncbi:hypothetical protein [Nocardioides sp. SYSU D00038]|uniref:hypothetical protein n=1 Tax=Nocardioides sp. SYSU D00038 TaxID=2812554 RepID=UPI00196716C5|nr:hypothetical protein [Nocardioides sp. SYSU D00038]